MADKTEEEEIWKIYPEYDFIEVSNLGRVRTKDRTVIRKNGRKCFIKGRTLKQQRDHQGYIYVQFKVNGKQIHLFVHRAVATSFLPNPDNLPEVNHKDNDPTNNDASNLEWCTHEKNMAYKEKFGISAKDAAEALRRSVIAVNTETFEVFWFESRNEAARQLDVNVGHVSEVVKGKRNKDKVYWFTDADKKAVENTRKNFGGDIAEKVEELMRQNQN